MGTLMQFQSVKGFSMLFKRLITKTLDRQLAHNALWMLVAQGGRVLAQGLYFGLLARYLGASGFGAFAAALSLAYMLVPLASLGAGNVLIQEVARVPTTIRVHWGNALLLSGLAGTSLSLLLSFAGTKLLPDVPVTVLVSVSISELVLGRVTDTAGQAFQALERLDMTAYLHLWFAAARLAAAIAFVSATDNPSPGQWGYYYLGTSAIVALGSGLFVTSRLGTPRVSLESICLNAKQGIYFSVGSVAQTLYTDLDKMLLARFDTLDAVGVYSAAYRVISLAFSPVRSLLYASYARFFHHGRRGLRETATFAVRLLPISLTYGTVAGLVLLIAAPVVQFALGEEYQGSVEALRWLAMLPLVQGLHYFAADALTGAGYQGFRTLVQVLVAALNGILNVVLIPRFSWVGAAWATLVTECSLAIALWLAVLVLQSSGEIRDV